MYYEVLYYLPVIFLGLLVATPLICLQGRVLKLLTPECVV